MGAWATSVAGVALNAGQSATNVMNDRLSTRGGETNVKTSSASVLGTEYTLVGMNVNKVKLVTDAIDQYIKYINDKLDQVNALAEADNAFKGGNLQDAVKRYIDKEKQYCEGLCSQLKAFEDKIVDAKTAWEQSVSSFAESVDTESSNLTSDFYTRRTSL